MQPMEIRALMNNIAPVLKDFVSQSLSPVLVRLEEIDKRISEFPVPRDGKDADVDAVAGIISVQVQSELDELRKDLTSMIPEVVEKFVSSIPTPKDGEPGKSVTTDDVLPLLLEEMSKAVAALPTPKDGEPGKSVTTDDIKPILIEEVSKAVAALPAPKDGEPGKSVTVHELVPVISEHVAKAIATIPIPKDAPPIEPVAIASAVAGYLKENPPPAGKDGTNLTDVLLDREGNLTTVFSNGITKTLGKVVGKDGEPGRSVTADDIKSMLVEEVSKAVVALPPPKDSEVDVTSIDLDEETSKSVAAALRLLAERPDMTTMMLKEASVVPPQPPVNIHLPPVIMPEISFPAPVVNVAPAVNNIPAPIVNVGDRVGKKTRNVVKKHFKDGRIQEFEQEVIS